MIKVRAIQEGFYGDRRIHEGEVFEIKNEKAFSKRWMVKVKKSQTPTPLVEDDETEEEVEEEEEPAPETLGGMDAKVNKALNQLDHANDEHWTDKGFPSMDAVKVFMLDESVTRGNVESARPGFRREK